jgi:hypothetical protein
MDSRLPDSDEYLARLEAKLKRIQVKNQNNVDGKTMIKFMSEFREIYMINAFQNNLNLNQSNQGESYTNVNYLQRLISPIQQVNTEESKCLVENDWLEKTLANETNDVPTGTEECEVD